MNTDKNHNPRVLLNVEPNEDFGYMLKLLLGINLQVLQYYQHNKTKLSFSSVAKFMLTVL